MRLQLIIPAQYKLLLFSFINLLCILHITNHIAYYNLLQIAIIKILTTL